MTPTDPELPITTLLTRWNRGDPSALGEVMSLVYDRLSDMAHAQLLREGTNSIETAGMVNELYLRLRDSNVEVIDLNHFLRLASRVMRNVLVDRARAARAAKRGFGLNVTLTTGMGPMLASGREIERLHDAIKALATKDPAKAEMIDLVYFAGLTGEEAASALGLPLSSFCRELNFARAWLKSELEK